MQIQNGCRNDLAGAAAIYPVQSTDENLVAGVMVALPLCCAYTCWLAFTSTWKRLTA